MVLLRRRARERWRALALVTALLAPLAELTNARAGGVLVPPRWVQRSPTSSGSLRASWEALLFAQLEEGDRRWLPRAQRLPDGRTRYSYRRRQGEPPLTLPQIQELIRNPPRFTAERRAITALLERLRILGVQVDLKPAGRPSAAGEWDPARATVRIRPDVAALGSRDFARVLNHEAIHVAQSCRGGGVRRNPVPLGLSRRLTTENAALLAQPPYQRIPARARQLEEEAFAHQDDLSMGLTLLARLCRPAAT
ncbi:hypothetical protein [Synechococcus sp. CCY 9618]|uniref:hypothetical protein n=1 Tax=Synechococcus sp. CCY 9618 TaxID=2815602 RepID=UPI001C24473F|nr:hypothetical protein [Synechococcus sp. CCY 9618]